MFHPSKIQTLEKSKKYIKSPLLSPLGGLLVYNDKLGAPFLAPTHDQIIDGHVLHHLTTGVTSASGGELGYAYLTTYQ